MKCPHCHHIDSKVIESREVANGESTRRRRECLDCHNRYTTYERIERPNLIVLKKNGTRQLYDRQKLVAGLERACEKTTVSRAEFEELVANIEQRIYDDAVEGDVKSDCIGQIVMNHLADFNQVAYVRFASVYRSFTDLESFEHELSQIRHRLDSVQK